MVKKQLAKIQSVKEIARDTFEMVLENELISQKAQAGQFVHIAIKGHSLRRPISIASADPQTGNFTILFKTVGAGTSRLASYTVGQELDLLGPNGSAFPVDEIEPGQNLLLVGGGIGVPPIYFLAKQLQGLDLAIHAVLGFQSKEYLFYETAFRELANVTIVTDDGSYGKAGYVTDYLEQEVNFDKYFACGPMPMLKAVKASLPNLEGYLSFEERMACGIGACYACVIPTNTEAGYKKICQDGPVFLASEVTI